MPDWSERLKEAERKRKGGKFSPRAAWRLLDGEGDGCPGLTLDVLAGRWLIAGEQLPEGLIEEARRRGVEAWWKELTRGEKAGPELVAGDPGKDPFLVEENGVSLEMSLQAGYSQGLFLDQRDNRAEARRRLREGERFLNLFSYTGAFSVFAALAGAVTTSVDASGPALRWMERNFRHNGLDPADHHLVRGDALEWLGAFARKGRNFHGIVADPPTFGRAKGRKAWRVESGLPDLVAACLKVLAPGGWLLVTSNCRRMEPEGFRQRVEEGVELSWRKARISGGEPPPDFTARPGLHVAWVEER